MPGRILFQGSYSGLETLQTPTESRELGEKIATELGGALIKAGFELILNSGVALDKFIGEAAVTACGELKIDPRERIRTIPYGTTERRGPWFGMVLKPVERRSQEVRTFIVQEADAVVGLIGGKGTCDSLQKAVLARKPVFPIAIAGGGAQEEWERLFRSRYGHRKPGDIDFLNDLSLTPKALASEIAKRCSVLLAPLSRAYSKRIFIVHGHDTGLKNEVARILERLGLEPVILHEQADQGRTVFAKLREELSDVGFGIVLLTPDDKGSAGTGKKLAKRARQNVVFEHGWLMGALGPDRVCAVVKDQVEVPSDLQGVIYKHIPPGKSVDVVAFDLCRELKRAGYDVDANKLS